MTDEREEEENTKSVDPIRGVVNIIRGLQRIPFMLKKRLKWETLSEKQRGMIDQIEIMSKMGGMSKEFLKYDPEKSPKIEDRTNFNMKIKPKIKKLINFFTTPQQDQSTHFKYSRLYGFIIWTIIIGVLIYESVY